jgi:hypothetical protein
MERTTLDKFADALILFFDENKEFTISALMSVFDKDTGSFSFREN